MPTLEQKLTRFRKEIAELDSQIDAYTESLELMFRDWIRDLMEEFNFSEDPDSQDAILAELRAGNFPPELTDRLEDVLALYAEELSNIQGRFRIDQEDVDITDLVASNETAGLTAELLTASNSIASTMAFAAISGASVTFAEIAEDFITGRFSRLNTGLATSLAGYRSSFEIRKAQQVNQNPRFRYVGPIDNKNRDFCRHVLSQNKAFTIAEIDDLDSRPDAQLLPVFVFGGGHGCRHRWIFTDRA